MRKGSVAVKRGSRVKQGQKLGLVGLSGQTQFPHVHLSVRHNKKVIDPFIGTSPGEGCGTAKNILWSKSAFRKLNRETGGIFNAGFATSRPAVKSIRAGLYKDKVLSRSAPLLLLWADIYWVRKGDLLQMQIFDPGGKIIHFYKSEIPKTRARQLFYTGKKRKTPVLANGRIPRRDYPAASKRRGNIRGHESCQAGDLEISKTLFCHPATADQFWGAAHRQ